MLASAMNFAIGFFGYPFDGQYQQSIIIEAFGVCLPTVSTYCDANHHAYSLSVQQYPCPLHDVRSSIYVLEYSLPDHLFTFSCQNALIPTKGDRGLWYLQRWANIYLKHARKRLQKQLHGLDLSIEDVHTMQQMCAYEVLRLFFRALGLPTQLDTLDRGTWIL